MNKLKTIVIDDEPLARALLMEELLSFPEIEVVAQAGNGYEGLKVINELQPDLIFLDVQMPKINGFEMLELIENPPQVIFVTAHDEYALNAFNVNAVDYLLKPINPERLKGAIEKVEKKIATKQSIETPNVLLPEQMQRLVVKDNNAIKIIPVSQITHIEAADDYIKIYTPERYYLKHLTMTKVGQQLPAAQFIRIHRSYFVNVSYIVKIELLEKEQYCVVLQNGTLLNVSKSGYTQLKNILHI